METFIQTHIIPYADILAIPFFALSIIYFYRIKKKGIIEYILLVFSITGFIMDTLFSYLFIKGIYTDK